MSARQQILAQLDLFNVLPPRELEALAASAHERRYAPGEDLFLEGETCRGIYIVAEGLVRIVKTTSTGRQVMLAMQQAPSTVAEVPVFDGGPYPATITAVTEVEAFSIYRNDFLACCRRNPELALRFLEVFGARLRQLVNLVERITFGSVRQRLAETLLEFSETGGGPAFALPETQEQMASRLGTVREVVSRNLSRFQSEGLIRISRRDVEIVNPAGLRAEAETEI